MLVPIAMRRGLCLAFCLWSAVSCRSVQPPCRCPTPPTCPTPVVPVPPEKDVPKEPERVLLDPAESMRKVDAPKELEDDADLPSLVEAVEAQIAFLDAKPGFQTFRFGNVSLSKEEYLSGLRRFVELGSKVKEPSDRTEFFAAVRDEFDFYQVFGQKDWGETLITGYYEPLVQGSKTPTKLLSQPLYASPNDLITLDLSLFDSKFQLERKLRGRVEGKKFVPYYTRKEIDEKGVLDDQKLALCFVHEIDAYQLHTEGSGVITLEDGQSIHVTALDKNGHRFTGYSAELVRKALEHKMSVEAYLRTLSPKAMRAFLHENPSYVFFKQTEGENTTLGMTATGGRTIATDARFFPKGTLGFLVSHAGTYPKDVEVPKSLRTISRFVLDQDTGGKILGGGRVDLFWGLGPDAKKQADRTKQWGVLYYLVPKPQCKPHTPGQVFAKK